VGKLGKGQRVKTRCTEVVRVDVGHYRKYSRLCRAQKRVIASTVINLRSEYKQRQFL
jgi:hypothetical protein